MKENISTYIKRNRKECTKINTNTNGDKHNKTATIANIRTDKNSPTNATSQLLALNYFYKEVASWIISQRHLGLSTLV